MLVYNLNASLIQNDNLSTSKNNQNNILIFYSIKSD